MIRLSVVVIEHYSLRKQRLQRNWCFPILEPMIDGDDYTLSGETDIITYR